MATTTTSKKKTTTKKATKTAAKKPVAKKSTKAAASSRKTTTKKAAAKKSNVKKVVTVPASKSSVSKKQSKKASIKDVASVGAKSGSKKTPRDIFDKLNLWNWIMAGLHTIQGAAIIILSRSDSLFPVTTTYITQDTLASSEGIPVLVQAQRSLFDINLAYVVAAFFFMSALAHLFVATVYKRRYEAELKTNLNRVRWYEYGISASTMMVAIAALSGVSDLSTFVVIFGATLVMNLLGLVMEIHNQTTAKTNWISYVVGTISGLLPWIVIGIYFFGANQYGSGDIPTFVYAIYASLFVFFSSFAVNMYLQYKGIGKWKDYLYGERAYMILSLVAKSALAWQVFAGTLRP